MIERYFRLLRWGALGIAGYHALGALGVLVHDGASPTRHAVFVGICLVGAWALRARPRWLLPAAACLVVQQTLSHGGRAWRWWSAQHRIDGASIVLLVALYVGLWLLGRERGRARETAGPTAP
jgi:hypothetical protein